MFKRNLDQKKIFEEKIYQKYLNRKLYQKIFEDQILPKYPKTYSPPNNLWRETLYQTNFE